jgi:MFS family permease
VNNLQKISAIIRALMSTLPIMLALMGSILCESPTVVINEIMCHPISGLNDDEYVELYNRGDNSMNLAGWRLADGISFVFPSSVVVAPDGYVVVAANLLMGWVSSLVWLVLFACLNGAGQSAGWPGLVKNIGPWFRRHERGVVMAWWTTT